MGLFDRVSDFEATCPRCGAKVSDFQTKDFDPCQREVSFRDVDNFYASCPECGLWLEFRLNRVARERLAVEDYGLVDEHDKR